LSTHVRLCLPSGRFPSGLPTSVLYAFVLHAQHWPDHSNYTWRRVQIMKLLIMQFSPTSVEIYFLKYFQFLAVTFSKFRFFSVYTIFQKSWRGGRCLAYSCRPPIKLFLLQDRI
jgi:hypothetical protein